MRMHKIGVLVLCLSANIAFSSYCKDISGLWQNQLGSNMTIFLMSGNRINGEYSTAVESKRGAALITSNVTGILTPLDDGALFAFTVLFNHGKSLTTWVGQCMVCNEEETLFTTWTLRSYLPKPNDRWMTNHINQDTFKRVSHVPNSIPKHFMGPSEKDERSMSCEKNLKAGVGGYWVSDSSGAFQFRDCSESGLLTGSYRDKSFIGRTDGGGSFTALGLVSSSPKQIKGWTGHIYENVIENERKMETSWLIHSFSDNCKDPRSLVRFGKDSYMYILNYKDSFEKDESIVKRFFNYLWSLAF